MCNVLLVCEQDIILLSYFKKAPLKYVIELHIQTY